MLALVLKSSQLLIAVADRDTGATASDNACAFAVTDRGLLRLVVGPWSPVPKCDAPGAPISFEEHTSMAPRPAAKVRILRFKNLPPFRHDPGLQIPRSRYSPGLAPTTRLNALLNAASDS